MMHTGARRILAIIMLIIVFPVATTAAEKKRSVDLVLGSAIHLTSVFKSSDDFFARKENTFAPRLQAGFKLNLPIYQPSGSWGLQFGFAALFGYQSQIESCAPCGCQVLDLDWAFVTLHLYPSLLIYLSPFEYPVYFYFDMGLGFVVTLIDHNPTYYDPGLHSYVSFTAKPAIGIGMLLTDSFSIALEPVAFGIDVPFSGLWEDAVGVQAVYEIRLLGGLVF